MGVPTDAQPHATYGEDAEAVVRAALGLTVGVGAVSAAASAASGELPLMAAPILVLTGCLLARAVAMAAYAAAAAWLLILPVAPGEALLVPGTMIVVCLAIALGPERLFTWMVRDATPEYRPAAPADDGWIEELRT